MNILSPSILAADFGRLEAHCREAAEAGVRWLHIDVMDGNFVPNISFGAVAVKALRRLANQYGMTLDVHLMIENPELYVEEFAAAGSDIITIHVEATKHIHRAIEQIKATGVKAGITLNPGTPLSSIEEVLPDVDLVLVMSVNPGFGGQSYIPSSTDKIKRLRRSLDAMGSSAYLEVDGGVKVSNVAEIVEAGANVIVAGSAVFGGNKVVAENVADFEEKMNNVSRPSAIAK